MTLSALGIFSAAGAGGVAFSSDYELISTTTLGTATNSVTFSSLGTYSSTYKHLQIRYAAKQSNSTSVGVYGRFNGDTAGNYSWHYLAGNGSSVSSSALTSTTSMLVGSAFGTGTANAFGGGVIDILDTYSTTKNKTVRSLEGRASEWVALESGSWRNTASITSITLFPDVYNFSTGSRFSLYGIKG
jgi:hypothetical protein